MTELTDKALDSLESEIQRDHMRWDSVLVRLVQTEVPALIAEVRRLRSKLDGVPDIIAANIRHMGIDLQMEHPMFMVMADLLYREFKAMGGVNYVEARLMAHDEEQGDQEIVVTLQRATGKTPHELRQEAEAEVRRLRERVAGLEAEAVKWRGAVGRLVFALENAFPGDRHFYELEAMAMGRELLPDKRWWIDDAIADMEAESGMEAPSNFGDKDWSLDWWKREEPADD